MIEEFKAWLRQPFSADMDAAHWFYFFGLLIIISAAWGFILKHIERGIE